MMGAPNSWPSNALLVLGKSKRYALDENPLCSQLSVNNQLQELDELRNVFRPAHYGSQFR